MIRKTAKQLRKIKAMVEKKTMDKETKHNIPKEEKEALRFLEQDFSQCFQQIRHYDAQIFIIIKFMFAVYSTLIGVSLGFYKYGVEKMLDITLPVKAVLSVGVVLGLLMFALVIRNRYYFVKTVHYINEIRNLFLQCKPLGFENKSQMYTDHLKPPFFNVNSSQAWLIYVISALNSTLLGVLLFIMFYTNSYTWKIVWGGSLIMFITQLIIAILHLKNVT